MAFDIQKAKEAGASDEAIAAHLAKKHGFNIQGATEKGASSSDIVTHLMKKETPVKAQQPQEATGEQQSPSTFDATLGTGSPIARFLKGAVVDPALGLNQLFANTGLFGDTVKKGATQNVQAYNKATNDARAMLGSTGFDPIQFGGAILSPVNKAGMAAQGANLLGRTVTGATTGVGQGLMIPTEREGDEGAADKLISAAIGGAFGGAIPAGVAGFKQLVAFVSRLPYSQAAKNRALQKYMGDLVPEQDRPQVMGALRDTTPNIEGRQMSAGEALADTPVGIPLIKEQERVLLSNPALARERDLQNQQANRQAIEGAFGKESDIPAAMAERSAVTGELRETAMREADRYGNEVGKPGWLSNATNALETRKAATEVGDSVKQRAADVQVKKNQLETLKEEGFYPLKVDSILTEIDRLATTPGSQSNTILQVAIDSMRNKLIKFTDPDTGIIKSDDLYNIRKQIEEDMVKFLGENKTLGKEAAADERMLRGLFDASIEKASGSGTWKRYLDEFATRSKQIDQIKVGRAFLNKLGFDSASGAQQAGTFINAFTNATKTIKEVTKRNYNKIEDFATPKQINVLKSLSADVSRAERAQLAASYGKTSEGVANEAQVLPSLINQSLAVTKSILGTLQKGSQKEYDLKMAELMLDPKKLADFIEFLPKNRVKEVTEVMATKMSPNIREQFVKLIMPQQTSGSVVNEEQVAPSLINQALNAGKSILKSTSSVGGLRDYQSQQIINER
tara:strand:+ start:661 stop:2877 length:2217 start_codon:yes stop_codon:yes gene_type:complete